MAQPEISSDDPVVAFQGDDRFIENTLRANNIMAISLLLISIVAILVSIFIYTSFRMLQTLRTFLLKHLLMAFLVEAFFNIVQQGIYLYQRHSRIEDMRTIFRTSVFCEFLVVALMVAELSTLTWFVAVLWEQRAFEVGVAKASSTPYVLVGWGVPFLPVGVWLALVLTLTEADKCLGRNLFHPLIWVVDGSRIALTLASCLLLLLVLWRLCHRRDVIRLYDELVRRRRYSKQLCIVFIAVLVTQIISLQASHLHVETSARAALSYVRTALRASRGLIAACALCFLDREMHMAFQPPEASVA